MHAPNKKDTIHSTKLNPNHSPTRPSIHSTGFAVATAVDSASQLHSRVALQCWSLWHLPRHAAQAGWDFPVEFLAPGRASPKCRSRRQLCPSKAALQRQKSIPIAATHTTREQAGSIRINVSGSVKDQCRQSWSSVSLRVLSRWHSGSNRAYSLWRRARGLLHLNLVVTLGLYALAKVAAMIESKIS